MDVSGAEDSGGRSSSSLNAMGTARHEFPTTQVNLVERAGRASERAALAELCKAYWYPVYCFLRRLGVSASEIEDVTQGFFASLLNEGAESGSTQLAKYDRARSQFRSWLRTRARWFFYNHLDHRKVETGGYPHVSLDMDAAEALYRAESGSVETPDQLFDHCWAQVVVQRARARLEESYVNHPKRPEVEALLAEFDDEPPEPPTPKGPVSGTKRQQKFKLKRDLRRPFQRCLRQELAWTLPRGATVDDEIELLLNALSD